MKLKKCKWCKISHVHKQVKGFHGVCSKCLKYRQNKVDYKKPDGYPLPDDENVSNEVLRALVVMDYCDEAQKVMDQRIAKMTSEIQDCWTEKVRERRAVSKKNNGSIVPSFSSSGRAKFRLYEPTVQNRT